MCRFMVYKGSDEILLSKLILDPTHSILNQSFDSRLRLDRRRPHNGDGFGIGYYPDQKLGPEPSSKTASRLIFAHVRATTEGSLSEDNCHPFSHSSLMWMHNGGLGAWKHIKRKLGEHLADKWYLGVHGSTDSEWAFALYLDTLERMGHNPSSPPDTGFGPTVLRSAMLRTINQINSFVADIPSSIIEEENVDTRSLLNFAVTDGHSVVCTRYISSQTDEASSLYYSSGTCWEDKSTKGEYQMNHRHKGADIVLVASEPLTFERESWVTVPTNSTLTIHKQTVMVHPIIDKYYSFDPAHSRSTKCVTEKGLLANEKATFDVTSSTPRIVDSSLRDSIASAINETSSSKATLTSSRAQSLALQSLQPTSIPKRNQSLPHRRGAAPGSMVPHVDLHNSTCSVSGVGVCSKSLQEMPRNLQLGNYSKHDPKDNHNPSSQTKSTGPIKVLSMPSHGGDPVKIAKLFPELGIKDEIFCHENRPFAMSRS
ncbi:hypothetical protein K3495_g4967 [Podosphaera aphanis]|nr:hypothetical protein K3495_g4967 [Podosphaera aphanis]